MLPKVEQAVLRAIDPHLGHGYLGRDDLRLLLDEDFVGGCVRIGSDEPERPRVGVVGGSTSDVSYDGSWLRPFRATSEASGKAVTLYSGAVSGYASSQDLLKLIRDLIPVAPKLVLTLSGINDLGFIQAAAPEHPMVHAYQMGLCRHLVRKPEMRSFFAAPALTLTGMNRKYAIDGIATGSRNTLSAAQVWARNMRLMRGVCQASGAEFRCFLQPLAGFGEYALSVDEQESFDAYTTEQRERGVDYPARLQEFYAEARTIVREHSDFMVDLVDVFRGMREQYADIRHPNTSGNARIAAAIFAHCAALL